MAGRGGQGESPFHHQKKQTHPQHVWRRGRGGQPAHPGTPASAVAVHIVPTDHDILSGRGISIAQHPGNERFRTLVRSRLDADYCHKYTTPEKMAVAREIIQHIRSLQPPGRFLKRPGNARSAKGLDGPWEELTEAETIKKTCQALRDCNRPDRTGYAEMVRPPDDVRHNQALRSQAGLTNKQYAEQAAAVAHKQDVEQADEFSVVAAVAAQATQQLLHQHMSGQLQQRSEHSLLQADKDDLFGDFSIGKRPRADSTSLFVASLSSATLGQVEGLKKLRSAVPERPGATSQIWDRTPLDATPTTAATSGATFHDSLLHESALYRRAHGSGNDDDDVDITADDSLSSPMALPSGSAAASVDVFLADHHSHGPASPAAASTTFDDDDDDDDNGHHNSRHLAGLGETHAGSTSSFDLFVAARRGTIDDEDDGDLKPAASRFQLSSSLEHASSFMHHHHDLDTFRLAEAASAFEGSHAGEELGNDDDDSVERLSMSIGHDHYPPPSPLHSLAHDNEIGEDHVHDTADLDQTSIIFHDPRAC